MDLVADEMMWRPTYRENEKRGKDMTANTKIFLSVMSDDFGMCDAVNEGIVQAYTKGVLTDTNLMAPAPAFPAAARLAKTHKIPVGIHVTFTAEWDVLRWKPLTPLKSMTQPDGTFPFTVKEAWRKADLREAKIELEAQWNRIEAEGLSITHACEHMHKDPWGKLAGLLAHFLRQKRIPSRNRSSAKKHHIPRTDWVSTFESSGVSLDREVAKKKLKSWIDSLGPGHHLWQCHCAIEGPTLEKMCSPSHRDFHWARTYRLIDQSLVTDPEVRAWIEKRAIQLVPISSCPVSGFESFGTSLLFSTGLKTLSFKTKRLISKLLPSFIKNFIRETRNKLNQVLYTGNQKFCPICEKTSRCFRPYTDGFVPFEDVECVFCFSHGRHRLLWLYLIQKTNLLDGKPKKVLHVAPESCFEPMFTKSFGSGYVTADLFNPLARLKMDVMDIQYPDQTFDVILCNYVLQEVADDKKALREFYRVLKNDGWAILLAPIFVEKTLEDPLLQKPEERLKAYSEADSVRVYGPDYVERLREVGFKISITKVNDFVKHEDAVRMGLLTPETGEIYFCTK